MSEIEGIYLGSSKYHLATTSAGRILHIKELDPSCLKHWHLRLPADICIRLVGRGESTILTTITNLLDLHKESRFTKSNSWCKVSGRYWKCLNPRHHWDLKTWRKVAALEPEREWSEWDECLELMLEIDSNCLEIVKDHIYMEEFDEELVERVFATL